MALSMGTRLGPYEITGPLGAGGMGEVYRARDSRLNRDAAIKTLPAAFFDDSNRLARLQREAQVLASLNHPNIASIYGLEEDRGVRALVMELVEGPTLAERIAKGPIPLDEALGIARQIADALEAAHEKGIVHRDLKPANVKVTADDKVKVLDFGLAKAFDNETPSGNAENSPTLTQWA
jgi:eukaryotic-like serine/threonine-protein kinase